MIDSQSASGGETQIALKLVELEEAGLSFEEIVKQIEAFRDSVQTYFVLDNYNGRLFTPGNISSIREAIQLLITTSDEDLIRMSYKSRELSRRINPEIVAQTLLSVI